jgi:Zn-finger nucleic acid-binding protein
MKKAKLSGVLVDRCENCRSIWLDAGELQMLCKGKGKEDLELTVEARQEVYQENKRLVTSTSMCPKCQKEPLKTYRLNGIELDRCSNCKGIFFDWGELDKVMEREKNSGIGGGLKDFLRGLFRA